MVPTWKEFMDELGAADAAEGPEAVAQSRILRAHYAFATRVFQARKKLGLSQQELARAAGIDQAEVSRIERGESNPTMATVVRVLAAVKLSLRFESDPVRRKRGAKRAATLLHPRRSRKR